VLSVEVKPLATPGPPIADRMISTGETTDSIASAVFVSLKASCGVPCAVKAT
jgi:hypothetical protein